MHEQAIFDHLIFAGGPPRSGTTLLAQILSTHPQLVLAGDNRTYESWGLYRYADYTGLVEELRQGRIKGEEARRYLFMHIIKDGAVNKIAPSPFVRDNPRAFPDAPVNGIARFQLPLDAFGPDLRLCLKSPEISFVLPQLAESFPHARFVLVYRPVIETAESMFRKGHEWPNAYHRRWNSERDGSGRLIAPPSTPVDLIPYWGQVTDFQRCAIRATAFLRAMLEGVVSLPPDRVHIYDHPSMRANPKRGLAELANFLGIHADGFLFAKRHIRQDVPAPSAQMIQEFEAIAPILGLEQTMALAEELQNRRRF